MTHGVSSTDPTTAHIENDQSGDPSRGSAPPVIVTTDDSAAQEEKARVIEGLEGAMDLFRKGECTRFQTSALILGELEKWSRATDQEKGKAFKSYLAEINSFIAIQDESMSLARRGSPALGATLESGGRSKRVRDEVDEILDRVSKEERDDEEDEPKIIRRRAKEEEMPWYSNTGTSGRRISCVETCRTLLRFSEDLPGVRSLLRIANNLPEGIPTSQWDRMLRGESVDLNQVLSAMHYIHLDEERKVAWDQLKSYLQSQNRNGMSIPGQNGPQPTEGCPKGSSSFSPIEEKNSSNTPNTSKVFSQPNIRTPIPRSYSTISQSGIRSEEGRIFYSPTITGSTASVRPSCMPMELNTKDVEGGNPKEGRGR
jgi:hypothetical protein